MKYTAAPPSSASATADENNSSSSNAGYGTATDWLALPLDPLLNSLGAGVTQSSLMGPDVGGFDLLEVLLEEDMIDGVGVV